MRTSRFYKRSAALLVIAASLFATGTVFGELSRTWSDRSGQYSVEAEFTRIEGDEVILRRTDGSEIRVPIARLSDRDRQYLSTKQGGDRADAPDLKALGENFTTFKDLQRETRQYRSAAGVLAMYEAFFNSPNIAQSEKTKAQEEVEMWRDLASKKALRLGKKWIASSEIDAINKQEIELLSNVVDEACC